MTIDTAAAVVALSLLPNRTGDCVRGALLAPPSSHWNYRLSRTRPARQDRLSGGVESSLPRPLCSAPQLTRLL